MIAILAMFAVDVFVVIMLCFCCTWWYTVFVLICVSRTLLMWLVPLSMLFVMSILYMIPLFFFITTGVGVVVLGVVIYVVYVVRAVDCVIVVIVNVIVVVVVVDNVYVDVVLLCVVLCCCWLLCYHEHMRCCCCCLQCCCV